MIDIETTNSCENAVIASLLTANQELKNRISDYSRLIIEKDDLLKKLAKENNKLKNRISELKDDYSSLLNDLERANKEIDELEEMARIENEIY